MISGFYGANEYELRFEKQMGHLHLQHRTTYQPKRRDEKQ
jgi:hypothetical protein